MRAQESTGVFDNTFHGLAVRVVISLQQRVGPTVQGLMSCRSMHTGTLTPTQHIAQLERVWLYLLL